MTTTLSEGVKVPDVGSVNWAGDLEINWNLLNGALANLSGNVKLDRDNTWTGEQSFTLPIVGSITGTAAKAIADEDGTSIKTGYVNVAGNQTVTGNKTWSGDNTYSKPVVIERNTDTGNFLALRNSVAELGSTPASATPVTIAYRDKNNDNLGYMGVYYGTDGSNVFHLYVRNKFTSGSPSTSGTADYTYFGLKLNADKSKEGILKASFRPYDNNTYSLGSSSYQWSSVYAQTYYYNGTAWGLDKANEWTDTQTYSAGSYGKKILLKNTGLDFSVNGNTGLTGAYQHMIHWVDKNNAAYSSIQSWTASSENVLVLRSYYRTDANTSRNLSVRFVNTATNKSIYSETNADTDLGTSTNKWKTLNGINPGALSLPDFTSETGVSLSAGANTYTPVLSGWLSISTTGDISVVCGNFCHKATDMISVPVIAGKTYTVTMPSAATGYFYSCLGNV